MRIIPPDTWRHGLRLTAALCVSIGLAACAANQPPLATAATNIPGAGEATIEVIWPCLNSPLFGSGRGSVGSPILVDEKMAGRLSLCSHAKLAVPAGNYPIRIADPTLDLSGAFGNTGPKFDVKSGATLHFIVSRVSEVRVRLVPIDASRAQAEIAAIDSTP